MDLGTIEGLYARHGAMVLRRARAILGEDQAARDAMQEVFVRVLRDPGGFRGDASPVTWLYKITTNLCLNRIRDQARQRDLLAVRDTEAGGEPEAVSPETTAALRELLAQLPDELCEIAIHYYVDEMNQDEIASVLGVSRRTVGNRLESFRERARALAGRQEAG